MDTLSRFMEYAADFEKTLGDDDWTRLRRYFADDAVYEVKAEGFRTLALRLCQVVPTDGVRTHRL